MKDDDNKPIDMHKAEQGMTFVAENYPPFWRRMYLKLVEEGFDANQAIQLLMCYINTSCRSA